MTRSLWRMVPPPLDPSPCISTSTVVFGHATPPRVAGAPSTSPHWLMEPSDPNASPWGRQVGPCAIHGWACPNRVAPAQGPSSSGHQGEEEGREEADECRITVVTGPVGALVTRRMARITIGPRGRPQGPLAPRTEPSPPPSPTSSTLAAPPPALPSTEAGLLGSGTCSTSLQICKKN
jgi:hypothetical protein